MLFVAGPLAAETVVLDESGYFRMYCRFALNRYSPALVRSDGVKVLGQAGFDRLKRDTQTAMRQRGEDPANLDWTERVLSTIFRTFVPAAGPRPADAWPAADFDDSSWVRTLRPFQADAGFPSDLQSWGHFDEGADLRLKQAFYRARFVVDDPAKAGALTLDLACFGGARAFVNGREVGRVALPAGEIDPEAPAEDYPAKAYDDRNAADRERKLGPVVVPATLLVKGVNVLAIELRASDFNPVALTRPQVRNWGGPGRPFPHAKLVAVSLRAAGPGVSSGVKRPSGTQVWVEDIHRRVRSTDFLPPGEPPGVARLVAPRNATASAQIVIASDRPLTGLAVRAGALSSGKAALPASAVSVLYGIPFPVDQWDMKGLGDERGLDAKFPTMGELADFALMKDASNPWLFDELAAMPPKPAPAGARPVWLSVRVPADAAPGVYKGTVTASYVAHPPSGVASSSSAQPGAATLQVELEVIGWKLPDPKNFRTLVGCEENPYAVAKQYGLTLWSEEHWKRVESSVAQLGRIGNSWVNVPVILNTEFGNGGDSMVRWSRKGAGFAFDFALLDRYLDLTVKHCGKPRVVHFIVMPGMPPWAGVAKPQIKVDGAPMTMGPVKDLADEPKQAWLAFAKAAYEHLKARGLEKSMFWGAPLEGEADPDLKTLLARAAPEVFWTAGPHEMMSNGTYAKQEKFYHLVADIRYWGGWPNFRDDMGWKSRTLHLENPRVGGTCLAIHTTSHPFVWRALPEHALAFGRSGFTRIGADEWAANHYSGMGIPKWLTGMPALFVLWPGADGAGPSARFEAMLEGIQETEARIAIEQALDKGGVPDDVSRRARAVLARRLDETRFFLGNSVIHAYEEYYYGWQDRSRALYQAAAEAAQ